MLVCLGIGSVASVARADAPPQLAIQYVEDPYAPHVTDGTTLRLGTSVGFIHGQLEDVMAIGATLGVGHRYGRLAIEAELALANLDAEDGANTHLGTQQMLGVNARYDVVRIGPHYVGPNSLLALYVEGGAQRIWEQWSLPDAGDPERMVPDNSGRVAGDVGFGIMLEHRLQEPVSIPRRVAWFLGWRLGFTPHDAETAAIVAAPNVAPRPRCRKSRRPTPIARRCSSRACRSPGERVDQTREHREIPPRTGSRARPARAPRLRVHVRRPRGPRPSATRA